MRQRFTRFMRGRYGIDQFTNFLVWTGVVIWIVSRVIHGTVAGTPLGIIGTALVIYAYCRIFSRNVENRQVENEKFLYCIAGIRARKEQFDERRRLFRTNHIYTCPSCKQKIRVPRGKGKIAITCPCCRTEFIRRS